jgi:hypothetical protein
MSDAWYFAEGDRKIGPISLSELGSVLSRVPGAEKALVWRTGFANWTAAADVKELEAFLATPPPLPQPMAEAEINQPPEPSNVTRNYGPLLFVAVLGVWLVSSFYMYAYMWVLSYAIAGIFFLVAVILFWKKRNALALTVAERVNDFETPGVVRLASERV